MTANNESWQRRHEISLPDGRALTVHRHSGELLGELFILTHWTALSIEGSRAGHQVTCTPVEQALAAETWRLAARVRELECGLADQGRIYFLHGPPGTHDEQAIRAMRKHGQREAALARLAKLDALLASEEVPEGFWDAMDDTDTPLDTLGAAARAWQWLREKLGS